MNEKIKNTIAIIFIILALGVIGYCGYRIYNKLNGNDASNNVVEKKETNNKEENNNEENNSVVENDSKNADMNKSVLLNLYDNGVIKSMDIREAITSEIDFTLDYGKINNHNVKIKIYVHNTGINRYQNSQYRQVLDVYVDENKYNLLDGEGSYVYHTGIGELFENLEIKINNMGILFMSNIKSLFYDQATQPFVLIYNKSNQYEFIGEKITNKYVRTENTTYGYYDKNNEESWPINVSADSIEYCKYDNSDDKDFCGGKAKVTCVTYDGKKESIKQQFEAYIHEQLC